jgi:hypothetical protein
VQYLFLWHNLLALIIKHQNLPTFENDEDCVLDPKICVLQEQNPQILLPKAKPTQRKKFGYGIILTVAAMIKKFSGDSPIIVSTIIIQIKDIRLLVGISIDRINLLTPRFVFNAFQKSIPIFQMARIESTFVALPFRDVLADMPLKRA